MRKAYVVILSLIILSGCAINQEIVPLANNLDIQKIYIVRNFDDRFDPALSIIENKLREKEVEYKIINGSPPPEAEFHLEYGGEFTWDFKTYMSKFTISIYQNRRIIAGAEYNAKSGGFRLDKFAKIEEKTEPIIDKFFSNI